MLTDTLNTNEVKNSAGTEVEFSRHQINDRSTVFAQVSEAPATPHRLTISHQESGSGLGKRRRSVVRVDKTVVSTVDSSTPVVVSAYIVLDTPVGALVAYTEPTHVLAELISFCASLGASTTILYDGTGNGSQALLNGSL
jgi:hypothetical protein